MEKFNKILQNFYKEYIFEADVPGAVGDASQSALPGGGAEPPPVAAEPAAAPQPTQQAPSNATKRDTDPIAYTEQTLAKLVDPEQGITPDMFANFLNTFETGLSRISDKEGFKVFYRRLYERINKIVEAKQQLDNMFKKFHTAVSDTLRNKPEEPNNAGGGVGKAGPAGPGVK